MGLITNYKNSAGEDIGTTLVEKAYLLDRYPELADTFKQSGLWTWGAGTFGQIGDNTQTNKSSPVQTVAGGNNWKLVSSGRYATSGIKTDGTLWSWGLNTVGLLGDNTVANKSSPVQTISAGTNWKQVSVRGIFTSAIKTDGSLWLWGANTYGQLGDNTVTRKSSPVQTISGGTNWKLVSTGLNHVAAIKTNGSLWLWGRNESGQLGDTTITNKSSPVQTVSGGTNWKQVIACVGHTAAIKTDGSLWLWGINTNGELGDDTVTRKSSPVQTVSGGTNWKQVSSGSQYTTAIKTDGSLWLWGRNNNGQLGDNTVTNKSSPIQTVSGGTNWKLIESGFYHASAIKTDGTLWTWGAGTYGQLGDNTVTNKSSPIQTVSGGTNWKLISGGRYITSAIRDDSEDLL